MQTCETCVWLTTHPTLGPRCQRYPNPTSTSMSYFCGEHKDRPTPPAAVKEEASKGTTTAKEGTKNGTTRRAKTKAKPTSSASKD